MGVSENNSLEKLYLSQNNDVVDARLLQTVFPPSTQTSISKRKLQIASD